MVKRLIHRVLRKIGFELRRTSAEGSTIVHYNDNMRFGLERFKALNYPINTIVDVGAAEGRWSLSAQYYWPNASFILFEPLVERRLVLESLVKSSSNFCLVPMVAGSKEGAIDFAVSDDLDGSGVAACGGGNVRTLQVTSIQNEIRKNALSGPFIIKLDTHGFEVPILEGCRDIMDDISLFVIECYGIEITEDSLLFWQMCEYMGRLGFRLFDIVDVMRRPKDGAFWQCDAFFIRADSGIFLDKAFC